MFFSIVFVYAFAAQIYGRTPLFEERQKRRVGRFGPCGSLKTLVLIG